MTLTRIHDRGLYDPEHDHDWVPFRQGTEMCIYDGWKQLNDNELEICAKLRKLDGDSWRDVTDDERAAIREEIRREYST